MASEGLAPALDARRISKSFGGARALDGAALSIGRGELHGLVGANGSGKSTLVKVLAGYHAPAPGGRLTVGGRVVALPLRPGEPRALGMRFVHQDLGLIESLSVTENLRIEELAAARGSWVSWRREHALARELLDRFGLALDERAPVGGLSGAERAMLAIVRAAAAVPGVLVLDEPTAFLPHDERERVYALLRAVAAGGPGVLLVSHDLAEVVALAGRVTVLREGRDVATVGADGLNAATLAALMAGADRPERPADVERTRRPSGAEPAQRPAAAEPAPSPSRSRRGAARRAASAPRPLPDRAAFEVVDLTGSLLRDVSLSIRRGEVLGVGGLAGSGFAELPYLLFGARSARSGALILGPGHRDRLELVGLTPRRALAAGIALVPGERERDGGVASLPVADNLMLPVLHRFTRGPLLQRRRLLERAELLLLRHGVAPPEPLAALAALSGGNRQRALVAKWLQTAPRLLLLDEPLRGVDVGARPQIVRRIRELAAGGSAVLCASGDREQLAELCDRVLEFGDGRVVACWPSA